MLALHPSGQSPPSGECCHSNGMPRWKRFFDLISILFLAPFWIPVFIGTGIFIKLVSRDSIFFKQERIGHLGKSFILLKFRTMKLNASTVGHQGHLENLMSSNTPMTKMDSLGDSR